MHILGSTSAEIGTYFTRLSFLSHFPQDLDLKAPVTMSEYLRTSSEMSAFAFCSTSWQSTNYILSNRRRHSPEKLQKDIFKDSSSENV